MKSKFFLAASRQVHTPTYIGVPRLVEFVMLSETTPHDIHAHGAAWLQVGGHIGMHVTPTVRTIQHLGHGVDTRL